MHSNDPEVATDPDVAQRFTRPVVLGAGPVGTAIVAALRQRGHEPIVVTRSGARVPGAVARSADMADSDAALSVVSDASIVFSTAQPAYHRWAEEFPALQSSIVSACAAAGVPLMVVDNLYGYGDHDGPLSESTPMNPNSKKGAVRHQMWLELEAASNSGELEMAVIRASDFVGPGVEGSAFGTRFFDPLAKGKPAQTFGDVEARHSVTFIPDLGEATVRLGEDPSAWGRAWHAPNAPAVTQNELASIAAAAIGKEGRAKAMPVWMLRLAGLFVPPAKESIEMLFQFDDDFVVDSSAFTDHFGMEATSLDEALGAVMGVAA